MLCHAMLACGQALASTSRSGAAQQSAVRGLMQMQRMIQSRLQV